MRLPIYLFSILCTLGIVQGDWFGNPLALAQGRPASTAIAQAQGSMTTASPLKSGDRIRITVIGFSDLSGEQVIPASGLIQLPMVGEVQVIGLTTNQLSDRLMDALLPYVRRPQVSVTVMDISPLRISVTGEVLSPGPRLLNPSEIDLQLPLTLSSVLKLAGGVTPNADLRSIVIRRSPAIASLQQTYDQSSATLSPINYASTTSSRELSVNLWQAIASGELEADPLIYDGDEIIIPTVTLPSEEQQALLESTVAPDTIKVQVIGEVKKPGDVNTTPLTDLNGAIAAAGGFTEEANEGDIQLLRLLPDGRVHLQEVEFGQASGPLLSGDLVLVGRRRRPVRNFFDFVGTILRPVNTAIDVLTND